MNPRARMPQMRAVYVFLAVGIPLLGTGCLDRELKPLNPCLVSGVVAEIAVTNIDKIDLLFMVDNSGSMREEQVSLRSQFPSLINVLTSGDKSSPPDGVQDFPPAKDLHIGVVSSDLGLSGVLNIPDCDGLGDDGKLRNEAAGDVTGCSAATYMPRFLEYQEGVHDPAQLATDFQCIASLGTMGCGFEQQLESALKAVWPGDDPRIAFLPDPAGFGTEGQAGPAYTNGEFIRNDPTVGLSLIAIILVTDEEDCSSSDTRHFRPIDPTVPADDPLRRQGLNTRCFFEGQRAEPNSVYDVTRYINGFKALRQTEDLDNSKLVIFGGIVGVPTRLVTPERMADVDFAVKTQSDAFYDGILAADEMQEMVDMRGTPEVDDDNLRPSCDRGAMAKAYPPRRIVEVAKGFGSNGVIQSICQEDFGPAMQAIIDVIAKQLGAVCLPRSLVRNSDGLVGCNVVWEMPIPNTAPATTPVDCSLPFLLEPDPGRESSNMGRKVCKVAQLAVMGEGANKNHVPTDNGGTVYNDGWYYDEFSHDVEIECTGVEKQRIAFTTEAKPPTGVKVKLECLNETQSLADNRTNLRAGVEQPAIGDPCEEVTLRGNMVSGDEACVVLLADGAPDTSLFCHVQLNVCVLSCNGDADCPAAWVCDDRPASMMAASTDNAGVGRAYCVNPTCGGENK